MTMAPTGAGRVISSARHPGMWEVNDRWSYGFPTCMGGILLGRTVRGAHLINYNIITRRLSSRRATPSKWPAETARAVAVDHRDGVSLMKYLFVMVRTNIVVNGRL